LLRPSRSIDSRLGDILGNDSVLDVGVDELVDGKESEDHATDTGDTGVTRRFLITGSWICWRGGNIAFIAAARVGDITVRGSWKY